MKTTEIVLLLIVALLIACLVFREPAETIIVLVPLKSQPYQPRATATIHPEPVPKFHGFALA